MEKVADIYLHFQLLYTPAASLGKSVLQDMYKSHHPNSFSKFQGILLRLWACSSSTIISYIVIKNCIYFIIKIFKVSMIWLANVAKINFWSLINRFDFYGYYDHYRWIMADRWSGPCVYIATYCIYVNSTIYTDASRAARPARKSFFTQLLSSKFEFDFC